MRLTCTEQNENSQWRILAFCCRLVGLVCVGALLGGCAQTRRYPGRPSPRVLQKVLDPTSTDDLVQDMHPTAFLGQLDVPLGPCHIEILALPAQYQQAVDEGRLNYVVAAGATKVQLETVYPVLRDYHSVSRSWVSDDKTTIAFLMHAALGDFIFLSQDAGANWSRPLYLGLHRLPEAWYAPLADSRLPMISNGKVQLEVTIWKRDKSKAGSPLLGYQYLWKKWNRYLSISLVDLRRDSDGDGLTDLFEERILTDPRSPDTDRDGLTDGVDNQPLTPFPKNMTDSDEVVLSLIRDTSLPVISSILSSWRCHQNVSRFDRALMTKVLTKEGRAYYTEPRTEPIPINRTSIVISAGDSFPHITGESRVILLDQGTFQK